MRGSLQAIFARTGVPHGAKSLPETPMVCEAVQRKTTILLRFDVRAG